MSTCDIQWRRSGRLQIRVRWDPEDRCYHCRLVLKGEKVGEEHVKPVPTLGVCSHKAYDLAAQTAAQRAIEKGVIDRSDVFMLVGNTPRIEKTSTWKARYTPGWAGWDRGYGGSKGQR